MPEMTEDMNHLSEERVGLVSHECLSGELCKPKIGAWVCLGRVEAKREWNMLSRLFYWEEILSRLMPRN